MSDTTTNLTQLASFVGQFTVADQTSERGALAALAGNLARRPQRGVTDLLGAVLALSARTRRMVMPHVVIDLDVFSPDGARAVRVVMPHRG
jgi:hypothetical protein